MFEMRLWLGLVTANNKIHSFTDICKIHKKTYKITLMEN